MTHTATFGEATWMCEPNPCIPPPIFCSYVGGAPGKIDLYVGKEVVRRGIPMDGACDQLIELIKVRVQGGGTVGRDSRKGQ